MTLGGYSPSWTLSYFNGYFYGDIYGTNNIIVASKATGKFVATYETVCSGGIHSITFDSCGFMVVSCADDSNPSTIALYNANNGTYLNLQLTTSFQPFVTAVDASGRFVSSSWSAIDIYY